jgi:hypothetical protein
VIETDSIVNGREPAPSLPIVGARSAELHPHPNADNDK